MRNPLGLADSAAAEALAAELSARWAEPHRRYHTTAHLLAVLAAIKPLAAHADDLQAVRLAAWFHDAVYDGRPAQPVAASDEERSAQLAQSRLPACGVDPATIAEVARLVRITATHRYEPGDANAMVLCDADLSVLAGTPADYGAYARAVREEYHHVPDDQFRTGRAAVLRRLLEAEHLFGTPTGRALWEQAARANIARELEQLRPQPTT